MGSADGVAREPGAGDGLSRTGKKMRSGSDEALVAVVDDRPLRRAMLVNFLLGRQQQHRIAVREVASAGALADADAGQCDMFLVNLGCGSLRDPQGEMTLRLVAGARPDCPVVVLSDVDSDEEARLAHDRGARGFIPTRMEPDIVMAAIHFILSGGSYFPPECIERADRMAGPRAAGQMPAPRVHPATAGLATSGPGGVGPDRVQEPVATARPAPLQPPVVSLTARQEDVLGLLRGGRSNKEIALGLGLSEATVKVHVRQLMKKLGVSNRTQVALIASKPQFAGAPVGARTAGGSSH